MKGYEMAEFKKWGSVTPANTAPVSPPKATESAPQGNPTGAYDGPQYDNRIITLKYKSECKNGDRVVPAGARADFNFKTKAVTCLVCLGFEDEAGNVLRGKKPEAQ